MCGQKAERTADRHSSLLPSRRARLFFLFLALLAAGEGLLFFFVFRIPAAVLVLLLAPPLAFCLCLLFFLRPARAPRAPEEKEEVLRGILAQTESILAELRRQETRAYGAAPPEIRRNVQAHAKQIRLLASAGLPAPPEKWGETKIAVSEQNSLVLGEMLRAADTGGRAAVGPILPCILLFDRDCFAQVLDDVFSSLEREGGSIRVFFALSGDSMALTLSGLRRSGPQTDRAHPPFSPVSVKAVENRTGLSLSRSLMARMGGSLSCCVFSKGRSVCLRLPLAKNDGPSGSP